MIGWIVVGVVLASLLFLVLVTVPVLRRLPVLRRAMLGLQQRAAQAQGLEGHAEQLQRRAETLAEGAAHAQAAIAGIQARLPGRDETGRG